MFHSLMTGDVRLPASQPSGPQSTLVDRRHAECGSELALILMLIYFVLLSIGDGSRRRQVNLDGSKRQGL